LEFISSLFCILLRRLGTNASPFAMIDRIISQRSLSLEKEHMLSDVMNKGTEMFVLREMASLEYGQMKNFSMCFRGLP
jgi:hypothetical protein